jgi:hypothetical protein
MPLYSVWNPQTAAYDYYEAPGDAAAVPNPKHLRQKDLGTSVTASGWPLPAGARWVGRGDTAKGQISTPLAGADDTMVIQLWPWLPLALGAYFLWRHR